MQKYQEYKIVPDIIDSPPGEELSVEWKRSKVKCYPGDKLTPTQVHTPPVLDWRARQDNLYTVLFVHLRPVGEPVDEELHWLVFNIPQENMMRGQVHAEYLESGPTEGTGVHRYVYLVYRQPSTTRITPKFPYQPRHLDGRRPWNTRNFAKEYDLGKPVAGNFYMAEFDESVPPFVHEVTSNTGHFLDS
ncbi:protein D2 [Strongylocentrotus purpuratus]|uniref:Phosphatidylethanolamine-binding protein n=1 Tax=Strongylocentrotus purpuratus TaxID=7668 RepID=A0A7M7HIP7_STRPU|nr:protein D2 [Strongylocentrotus purpuratus]|eukprot:XP_011668158.1 PREDICTED: protein D2-like [Strongylocentrotus purpuratus]